MIEFTNPGGKPMIGCADAHFVELLRRVGGHGHTVNPRNGERRRILVPNPIRFHSTPLITLRSTAWKSALREWEWFMSGSSKLEDLHRSVRHWWQPWANRHGVVVYNYSKQFRRQQGNGGEVTPWHNVPCRGEFNQIAALIDGIKAKPYSARHVITTWYSAEMYAPECPITNCHGTVIQCWVDANKRLTLFMYQRSCDTVCGLPHNWIQYWAFGLWLAHRTGNTLDTFIWQGGDVHIYQQAHADMVQKILDASWRQDLKAPPELIYKPTSEAFKADDFRLDGNYSPVITDPVEMVV